MSDTGTYSINDLERLTGIKAHTLRIWEKRYGICDPGRSDGNIRNYNDTDLRLMLSVSILKRKGFKISHIAGMDEAELHLQVSRELLSNSGDQRVEDMIYAMVKLDEAGFNELIGRAIVDFGMEESFARFIHPFFDRIGIMWLAGSINPAHEHFVSNIIRHKLIVAINQLESPTLPDSKKFLLFLPDGEHHELGLLLYSYLIKKAGHRVFYLGQSTPYACVTNVAHSQDIDILFTSITSSLKDESLHHYLTKLTLEFSEKPILLSGMKVWENEENNIPQHPSLIRIAGAESLKAFLSEQLTASIS